MEYSECVLMLKFFLFLQRISEDFQLGRKRRVLSMPYILDGTHRLANLRTVFSLNIKKGIFF